MNAEQLWETTMNPENRTLYRVTIEQLKDPNKVFSDLMGDDVEPRREFILKNAQYATKYTNLSRDFFGANLLVLRVNKSSPSRG